MAQFNQHILMEIYVKQPEFSMSTTRTPPQRREHDFALYLSLIIHPTATLSCIAIVGLTICQCKGANLPASLFLHGEGFWIQSLCEVHAGEPWFTSVSYTHNHHHCRLRYLCWSLHVRPAFHPDDQMMVRIPISC